MTCQLAEHASQTKVSLVIVMFCIFKLFVVKSFKNMLNKYSKDMGV